MTELLFWENTPPKKAITDFGAKVTTPSGPDYVPPEERIATFDNDGTLWCERPLPQGAFIMQRLAAMAEKDPSLRQTQPWQAAYAQDFSWVDEAITKEHKGDSSDMTLLLNSSAKAFAEMSVAAFAALVTAYYQSARHPQYQVPYPQVVFLPMVELLAYLDANDFTTFIVSGGGRDFMRPITQQIYGVPAERVLGSSPTLSFKADDQGAQVVRQAGVSVFDEGPVKAVRIWEHIGRRPILAAGNTNGDLGMLQFTERKEHPTLRLLVVHDDADREYSYTAGTEKVVKMVQAQGGTQISMKNDWTQVFSFQEKA